MTQQSPPGWYSQPDGTRLFWDGRRWQRRSPANALKRAQRSVEPRATRARSPATERGSGCGMQLLWLLVVAGVAGGIWLAWLDRAESRDSALIQGPLILSGIIALVVLLFIVIVVVKTVRIVPQARAAIVERLGRYHRTLGAGLAIVVPFVDRVRPLLDLREQVVSFPPRPVITEDNLVVNIDSVIYFQVTDPKAATYEIQNFITGVEQLTVTTLRNVVGGMDLEHTLTSREEINLALRRVLDEATGKWGMRVNRVELKAIDPPPSVQQAMEKQMKAEREKRAAILAAEGNKQAAILNAEGARESAVLSAEGDAKARVLRADAEAQAIQQVVQAINQSGVTDDVLAYQYVQALPTVANGSADKVWVVPAELTNAMKDLGQAFAPGDDSTSQQAADAPGDSDTETGPASQP